MEIAGKYNLGQSDWYEHTSEKLQLEFNINLETEQEMNNNGDWNACLRDRDLLSHTRY